MKTKASRIKSFTKEESVLGYVMFALLVCEALIAFALAFPIEKDPVISARTLFRLAPRAACALLILTVLEVFFLLRKKERIFVPLGFVNAFFTFAVFYAISNGTASTNGLFSSLDTLIRVIYVDTFPVVGWILATLPRVELTKLLAVFHIIRLLAMINLVLLCSYVFLRLVKKIKPNTEPMTDNAELSALRRAKSTDKPLFYAAIMLIVAPFLPVRWIRAGSDIGFQAKPIFSYLIIFLACLLIYRLSLEKPVDKLVAVTEIVLLLTWNPLVLYYLGFYLPGIGYILIVGAFILMAVHIKRRRT